MSAAEAWIHSFYPSPFAGITQIRYWRSVTRPVTLSARFAPAPDTARIEHVRMEVNEWNYPRSPTGEVHLHNIGNSPSCCPSESDEGLGAMSARLDVKGTDADASNAASIQEESV